MPVDGVNPGGSNIFSNAANSEESKQMDKDAFLKLLVAEIKNQNPLEPMDNQKFVDQMTQFTTMEQMTNMSESFQKFITSMKSTTQLQASSVVGKYAVLEGNQIDFTDNSAESVVYNTEKAGEVIIRIRNQDGQLIREENLGFKEPGISSYQWDGRNGSGTIQPEGTYSYELVSVNEAGEEETFGGVEGGLVEAVQFMDDKIYVVVNGEKHRFENIVEISEAPEEEQQS